MSYNPLNPNGQATMANSQPVVIASDQSALTVASHAVTNAGTFAVQATEADGANTTLGAKADAKSTATDTTPISVMSVLKQISASVQAPPSQAVTNAGTFATQATLAAETTKVIGTVRNADGAGNLLTTNSTTYTAKFAQDANLLGTLGTAFSTAGKVDVKGADGDVFVRQATASNLNATVVGTGTFATQSTTATIPTATTMQNAATANGNGTNLPVSGYATAVLNVTASVAMSGGTTINFEASVDDTTWVSIYGTPTGALTAPVSTTTTTGDWTFAVSGYKSMRARISAYSAGTITVKGYTTLAVDSPVNLASQLYLSGTAVDGNSGNKSAGTLRAVIATDQPALTTAGLMSVKLDQTTPGTTNAVSLAQVGSTTVATGNGVVGAGVQRVAIASDNTAFSVNATLAAETTKVIGTVRNLGNGGATMDAAVGAATAPTNMLAVGGVYNSTQLSPTNGQSAALQLDKKANLMVANVATNQGGWSIATGSIGATKTDIGTANTAGQVGGWYIYNSNASVVYVQFFNTQASGVTLGTTAPVYSIGIPATAGANVEFTNGIAHSTAISIAITTTRAGSTGPSSTVDYNILYKQ